MIVLQILVPCFLLVMFTLLIAAIDYAVRDLIKRWKVR